RLLRFIHDRHDKEVSGCPDWFVSWFAPPQQWRHSRQQPVLSSSAGSAFRQSSYLRPPPTCLSQVCRLPGQCCRIYSADPALSRTLDPVGGLSQSIARSGGATLLELRRLRLDQLIRTNRATVESDGHGL